MRVRTFTAPSLPEAIMEVRRELGPAALVLSWRSVRGGVELSASTRRDDGADLSALEADAPPRPPAPDVEEFRAWNAALGDKAGKGRAPRFDVFDRPAAERAATPVPRAARGAAAQLLARQGAGSPAAASPQTPAPASAPAAAPPAAAPSGRGPRADPAIRLLMQAGLAPRAAARWREGLSGGDLRADLARFLGSGLGFAALEAAPRVPVALVGPPGCGKTVTAAKLAARALAAGATPVLVGADRDRCGGDSQLEALAGRLGTDLVLTGSVAELADVARAARAEGKAVLIDCLAAGPHQGSELRLCARLAEAARADMVVCLPADAREDDLLDHAQVWREAGATRAIVTRLDLTRRRAGVLDALMQAGLDLAQVSATPFIAGGLAPASAARLATLLLEPFPGAAEGREAAA